MEDWIAWLGVGSIGAVVIDREVEQAVVGLALRGGGGLGRAWIGGALVRELLQLVRKGREQLGARSTIATTLGCEIGGERRS